MILSDGKGCRGRRARRQKARDRCRSPVERHGFRRRSSYIDESFLVFEIVDPRLENNFSQGEMFRMVEAAAACVRHSAPKRPRMVQVVRALDTEGDNSDLSNGVKIGQSTVFDSSQYSADIQKFRMMAFGSLEYK